MKKLLEYFKKRLRIRKLVSKMELLSYNVPTNNFCFACENKNFKKKFNPSDYEIKGFTNPYKPDLSSKPKQKTIPMNPKLYSDLDFKGYTNPAKTFNKNTLPPPRGVK